MPIELPQSGTLRASGTCSLMNASVWAPADEPEVRERLPGVPLMFWLRVDEPFRRQGIGTALIREAESVLRRRGHRRVLIGVDQANLPARRLYLSLGYRPALTGLGGASGPYDILIGEILS